MVEVQDQESGERFAMKTISKSRLKRMRDRKRLKLELKIMTSLPPSPFIVRCHEAFETALEVFFVMDLVGGGDLFSHLAERFRITNSGFAESEVRVLAAEVVCGLQHLHGNKFIHRDI